MADLKRTFDEVFNVVRNDAQNLTQQRCNEPLQTWTWRGVLDNANREVNLFCDSCILVGDMGALLKIAHSTLLSQRDRAKGVMDEFRRVGDDGANSSRYEVDEVNAAVAASLTDFQTAKAQYELRSRQLREAITVCNSHSLRVREAYAAIAESKKRRVK